MDDHQPSRRGIGANFPPVPPVPAPEHITIALRETYAPLFQRSGELIAAVEEFIVECPEIEDDEQQAAATDNLEIMRQALVEAEQRRKDEKEPFLEGGRAVDAFFKTIKEPIEAAREKLHAVANAYADKLREARRVAAAEEARIKREQAERLIAEMDRGGSFEAARVAAEEAEAAGRLAAAGAHAHTVTVGSYGTKSAQHERWAWVVHDPDAVPRDLCSPDPVKINAAVKAGVRQAAGIRIFVERKLRTRS